MNLKGFFEDMAIAPESQMDKSVLPRFKALAEAKEPKAADLLRILDDCVYAGLCNGFCIRVMDSVWEYMLAKEGKTREQGFAEATWRNEKRD